MLNVGTRVKAIGAAAAVALALAGCSGSTSGDSVTTEAAFPTGSASGDAATTATASAAPENPADNEACQLIAAADIEAITALPFSTSVPEVTTTTKESEDCEWWLDEAVGLAGVVVQLMDGRGDQLSTTREVATTTFGDVVDIDVEGTTGAFTYMGGTILTMSVGGDLIQISYITFVAGDPIPIVEALAENIVANN